MVVSSVCTIIFYKPFINQKIMVHPKINLNQLSPEEAILTPTYASRALTSTIAKYTLFDLADKLRERGWLVPAYTMPKNREDLIVQRVVVKEGFSRDMADLCFTHKCQKQDSD
jgi:glutamate/tyrosine decarboxylase-like PLP-dependent enzyme